MDNIKELEKLAGEKLRYMGEVEIDFNRMVQEGKLREIGKGLYELTSWKPCDKRGR